MTVALYCIICLHYMQQNPTQGSLKITSSVIHHSLKKLSSHTYQYHNGWNYCELLKSLHFPCSHHKKCFAASTPPKDFKWDILYHSPEIMPIKVISCLKGTGLPSLKCSVHIKASIFQMYECGELQDKQGHFVVATLDDNGLSLFASNVFSLCLVSSKLRRYELCPKMTTILCPVNLKSLIWMLGSLCFNWELVSVQLEVKSSWRLSKGTY